MIIEWDGMGKNPHKAEGVLNAVKIPPDQCAVFVDSGAVLGMLQFGEYELNNDTAPFLNNATEATEMYLVYTRTVHDVSFGDRNGPQINDGPVSGKLRHFGRWSYSVTNPEAFVKAALDGDPIEAANLKIGQLFNACAHEWITGGYMKVTDLAANHEKFRQVLPSHIENAIAPLGLRLESLGDFTANIG